MVEVDPERFEAMVREALDGLPAELGELMSNVAVTVEHNEGPAGLLGLYRGIPFDPSYDGIRQCTSRPDHDLSASHLRGLSQRPDVLERVRRTVVHEVGHHFRIEDARLRELGW